MVYLSVRQMGKKRLQICRGGGRKYKRKESMGVNLRERMHFIWIFVCGMVVSIQDVMFIP